MIEVIFTLDYEIFGNGRGTFKDLIFEPAERLNIVFHKHGAPLVAFVEAAELEIIESYRRDPAVDVVKQQLHEFWADNYELGLHIHPQWYNARYLEGEWRLDYNEYNLCTLSPVRINQIIGRSLAYLKMVVGEPGFTPISFRAGNWLLQPTQEVAKALAGHGIKMDSSVYKGGLQHAHGLDYRRSEKNGYFWRFSEDVNAPSSPGILIEIPTYTSMVPIWKMFTARRIGLQQQGPTRMTFQHDRVARLRDLSRVRYPMKLDFCRLTAAQMVRMIDLEMEKDTKNPSLFRPIVAIGHTKDLVDLKHVDFFLSYLRNSGIPISTFRGVHDKILRQDGKS